MCFNGLFGHHLGVFLAQKDSFSFLEDNIHFKCVLVFYFISFLHLVDLLLQVIELVFVSLDAHLEGLLFLIPTFPFLCKGIFVLRILVTK